MPAPGGGLLRQDDRKSSKASFPELFFDLVFVFALIQLSETLAKDFSVSIAAEALLFILALWSVWIHTTWVTNLLNAEHESVRLLLFALMLCGILLAIALPEAFGEKGLLFAGAYAALQMTRSVFALVALRRAGSEQAGTFLRVTLWTAASAALWLAGGLADGQTRITLWAIALLIEYLAPVIRYWLPGLGRGTREETGINGEHLAERAALFVIIALGETILTTGKNASERFDETTTLPVLICAFVNTVLMWWLYFHDGQQQAAEKAEEAEDEAVSDKKPVGTVRTLFAYTHLPIVAGIILTAVGEDFALSHAHAMTPAHAAAILGGPALFLIGVGWMKLSAGAALPYSHAAGLALLALSGGAISLASNMGLQFFATAVLFGVCLWEYRALNRAKAVA
ncbi:Low temperature requirement protein LtrA [Rhizobium sp. RU20A]|uniref:low temperature requirement protein A n=1 Tax=Rhizobium sp. RU20A TaxID=1907412 RepID=UPI000955CD62|nr:low temperature requirement protein A [Rhizobium sp. RU20A]SIR27613.1 Low temperature requirement protein LtrA [Rhizobium sp. RU20A]